MKKAFLLITFVFSVALFADCPKELLRRKATFGESWSFFWSGKVAKTQILLNRVAAGRLGWFDDYVTAYSHLSFQDQLSSADSLLIVLQNTPEPVFTHLISKIRESKIFEAQVFDSFHRPSWTHQAALGKLRILVLSDHTRQAAVALRILTSLGQPGWDHLLLLSQRLFAQDSLKQLQGVEALSQALVDSKQDESRSKPNRRQVMEIVRSLDVLTKSEDEVGTKAKLAVAQYLALDPSLAFQRPFGLSIKQLVESSPEASAVLAERLALSKAQAVFIPMGKADSYRISTVLFEGPPIDLNDPKNAAVMKEYRLQTAYDSEKETGVLISPSGIGHHDIQVALGMMSGPSRRGILGGSRIGASAEEGRLSQDPSTHLMTPFEFLAREAQIFEYYFQVD